MCDPTRKKACAPSDSNEDGEKMTGLASTLAPNPRQSSVLVPHVHPLELPARFKSKGQSKVKHESAPVKAENLSEDVRSTLHEAEMEQEFARIPGERTRLGDVASIVTQNARSSTGGGQHPSTQILVDLSGRPELFTLARSAVTKFLADSGTQGGKRRNGST
ncbi:unnamed protein product, partial [Dibothriocephalus latus]